MKFAHLRAQQKPYLTAPKSLGLTLDTGGEQEFFSGELLEIILDALQAAGNNSQDDSRRQHILRSIVENNELERPIADTQRPPERDTETIPEYGR